MLVSILSGAESDFSVSGETSAARAPKLERRKRIVTAVAAATDPWRKGAFADCMSLSFVSFVEKRSSRPLRVH